MLTKPPGNAQQKPAWESKPSDQVHAFNMRVLKRHDAYIEDIIESASYVVLYSHDREWVSRDV
jgi:hypothetical protein